MAVLPHIRLLTYGKAEMAAPVRLESAGAGWEERFEPRTGQARIGQESLEHHLSEIGLEPHKAKRGRRGRDR